VVSKARPVDSTSDRKAPRRVRTLPSRHAVPA